ncbi:MAG: LCP family protein [Bacillota bacterium]
MNFRKFSLIVCSVLSSFMFCLGLLTLLYINLSADREKPRDSSQAFIHEILQPFKPAVEDINVLVLGGDKVNKNTDTIMLVNFNPSTAKISILSIPRDTKVRLNGSKAKINAAYPKGGAELAVETVSQLLGVDIEYYVFVNTSAFRKIIDKLGGVDYYVPVDMDYDDPIQNLHIHFKKGKHHFNGAQAEQFMRFRHYNNNKVNKYYDGSDLKRIDAQQNFIKELVRQKANLLYITKLNDILSVVFNNIETNLTMSEVLKMSGNISKINADQINMFKVPGESRRDGAWYYEIDSVETDKIINEHFSSKDAQ